MIGPPLWKLSMRKLPVSAAFAGAAAAGELPAGGCMPEAFEGDMPGAGARPGMLALGAAAVGASAGLVAGLAAVVVVVAPVAGEPVVAGGVVAWPKAVSAIVSENNVAGSSFFIGWKMGVWAGPGSLIPRYSPMK